jgi:hypothetical protein
MYRQLSRKIYSIVIGIVQQHIDCKNTNKQMFSKLLLVYEHVDIQSSICQYHRWTRMRWAIVGLDDLFIWKYFDTTRKKFDYLCKRGNKYLHLSLMMSGYAIRILFNTKSTYINDSINASRERKTDKETETDRQRGNVSCFVRFQMLL